MVSGRGLGHTGGTLDKLESIPGFRVDLDLDRYKRCSPTCGLVMIGQTAEIAPADKFLYALRDATATVESIPLISASIMSKKLAEGIDGLVLDVKTGDGAFMERLDDSRALAEAMCAIGRAGQADGRPDHADGSAARLRRGQRGRGGRVRRVLRRAGGPDDLVDLSIELAAEMVVMGDRAGSLEEARADLPRGRSPTARRSTRFAGWWKSRGVIPGPSTTSRACRRRAGKSS